MPAKKNPPSRGKKKGVASGPGPAQREEVEAFSKDVLRHMFVQLGKFPEVATPNDFYQALALTVRERLMRRWIRSAHEYFERRSRTVAYLSAEFLIGPQLMLNLHNLGLTEVARQAMALLGQDLLHLSDEEEEPGLGNGGLGRLAACYLDSLARLQIPAIGYGIRYEFGIFDQVIRDGWQVEITDKWLRLGSPWEVPKPEVQCPVGFGGHTEPFHDEAGRYRVRWHPARVVVGTPCDYPVLGYGVQNANVLRLWKAEACESFDFSAFNQGDYYGAVSEKMASETISKVLYPNDSNPAGRRLRLEQQAFFVSCSLQDMIRIYLQRDRNLENFHRKYAIQLNDTHPAVAVAELMRLLVDEHGLSWEAAWNTTSRSIGYTNHTLMPEALETWPVELFAAVLPRHLEIVFEINHRFLSEVRRRFPGDEERAARLSLIQEGPERRVRMANLAVVGSRAVNGVSALHSELLKQTVLRDFAELSPEKFRNVTNGVSPRRFMAVANPALAKLLDEVVGAGWEGDLERLSKLEALAGDGAFQERFRAVKRENKLALSQRLEQVSGVAVDPDSLFDVQVKRIHEYKRQHLNLLHVIALYRRLKAGNVKRPVPRTVIFGGKAAPGYAMAKRIIKLVHSVAEVVNADRETAPYLRVAFFPDFNVKNAQGIYPAAELSEQISTAGLEASGTGNMKFALNGALTIGTLDGANVEIRQRVGEDNFFLFGLTAPEVARRKASGYRPRQVVEENPELAGVLEALGSGAFSRGDRLLFAPLLDTLLFSDPFLVLADFAAYLACQERVAEAYRDTESWTRRAILNVARSAFFSADRAIAEYARDIWQAAPVPVPPDPGA